MRRRSNLDVERYYFSKFAEHFPLPDGKIEHGDKPDVIVYGAQDIGIEIANLYLHDRGDPASEQVQCRRREAVLRKAQILYESEGRPKYELTVSFDPLNPIVEGDVVAVRLAEFARSVELGAGGFFVGDILDQIPEVYSVFRSGAVYADSFWRTAQVYEGKSLSISRIAAILDDKHEKMKQYRPCDEYWLLLVVDMLDAAQDQEVDWPSGVPPLKSMFKKVIVYKPQYCRCLELPIDFV